MAEEPIDIEYSGLAKGRDVAFCLLAGAAVGGLAHLVFGDTERPDAFVVRSGAVCLPGVLILGLARWRRRGRLNESGITMSHGPDRPWTELSLDQIEGIRLYPDGGLDFIGAGTLVHVGGEMDGAAAVRNRLLARRGFGLFDRLRDAYQRGETLEFRGPRDPGVALFAAGLYIVFLGVPMVVLLTHPIPIVLSAAIALLLFRVLRREAWRSMEVALEPEGLRRRFGLGTRRFAWKSILDARLHENGALLLTLAGGDRASFPSTLSNFFTLQELVLRRVPSGAEKPGPPPA